MNSVRIINMSFKRHNNLAIFSNLDSKRSFVRASFVRCLSTGLSGQSSSFPRPEGNPVKYTTSKAFWNIDFDISKAKTRTMPKYQTHVVFVSMVSLLLWFGVLREPNDVDEQIEKGSLYDRIEGLEKLQLEKTLNYLTQNNLDATEVRRRLSEIYEEEERRRKAETPAKTEEKSS